MSKTIHVELQAGEEIVCPNCGGTGDDPETMICCLCGGDGVLTWGRVLDMLAGEYDKAERLLQEGLSVSPEPRTRADILETMEQVQMRRKASDDRS